MFSALKVPQSYLSRGEGAEEDKTTLAQKDIRFARTIQRLQRSVLTELEKVGIVHLYILGFREEDLVNFKVSLNNPSKLAELQELEHWKTKFEVAGSATEGFFSKRWIAHKMFGLTDEEIIRNQREMFYDRRFDASLEAAAEAEAASAASAGPGGGMGDLGAEADQGAGFDLGGEIEGAVGGEGAPLDTPDATTPPETEELPPDDTAPEGSLLAEPGKRDDGPTRYIAGDGFQTTDKSHGWYNPAKNRGGDKRKGSGPRKKARLAQGAHATTKSTMTNIFKGGGPLLGLGRGIVSESDTNYSEDEEKKLFKVSKEIEMILTGLDKRNKNET